MAISNEEKNVKLEHGEFQTKILKLHKYNMQIPTVHCILQGSNLRQLILIYIFLWKNSNEQIVL